MNRIHGLALAAALAGTAGAPADARADDAGVLRAFERDRAAHRAAQAEIEREGRIYLVIGRAKPLLADLARGRALIIRTRRAVLAEQPSTPTGASARTAGLESLSRYERGILALRAGVFAREAGRRRESGALVRRASAHFRIGDQAAARARTLFRQAGLSPAT